jgi:hypothetical protein
MSNKKLSKNSSTFFLNGRDRNINYSSHHSNISQFNPGKLATSLMDSIKPPSTNRLNGMYNTASRLTSTNSLNKYMDGRKKSIDSQLSNITNGMEKMERTKQKIINDLEQYKKKTTVKLVDLEKIVHTFYKFVVQLNTILMDTDANKLKNIEEIINKMKANKPFIKHVSDVINSYGDETDQGGEETDLLDLGEEMNKSNKYTATSVRSKLDKLKINNAITSINKIL